MDLTHGEKQRYARVSPHHHILSDLSAVARLQTFTGDDSPLLVTEEVGFGLIHQYIDKRKQKHYKPGLYSIAAGSLLEFEVDTTRTGIPASYILTGNNSVAEVLVSYMESYGGWANATVSCVAGCECKPVTVVAEHNDTHSVTQTAILSTAISQSSCKVRVSIPEDAAESCKFKVSHVKARIRIVKQLQRGRSRRRRRGSLV